MRNYTPGYSGHFLQEPQVPTIDRLQLHGFKNNKNVFNGIFNSLLKTIGFVNDAIRNQNSNRKYLMIKRRSKLHQKNMLRKHALNFDQWKTFSRN